MSIAALYQENNKKEEDQRKKKKETLRQSAGYSELFMNSEK